jgi:hypothetical protein
MDALLTSKCVKFIGSAVERVDRLLGAVELTNYAGGFSRAHSVS